MQLRPLRHLALCSALCLISACASAPAPVKSADTYFKEGEAAFAKRNYNEAIESWKKVKESDTAPALTSQAELKIADAHFENKAYIEAAAAYEDFRKLHPTHHQAPYALYRLALSHYQQIAGTDTDQTPVKDAVATLEAFLGQYPRSEYAPELSKKLADCRDKQLAYENYVGNFYLRTEKYQSAIKRLNEALVRFTGLSRLDDTLFYLGKAYLKAGELQQGKVALQRLAAEYPASPRNKEASLLLQKGFAGYSSQGV
ncbi:outer membrane assembly lipoprotein YfiO [Geoanaerobacter pelophilus]|uniref:Outer membrane assembly lipoprotein YfiO n=1 Tax=Geoanaerobacter pelophilus TaxID=60036 RepID=A0ABQ0ML69_9BACT|nr:outer membrane protein assembly factor BamD [Geoanaerobacter pelophilus]GAW67820.1 outer membrane assembly lipoprotein YfiO [Geoanaerobacter pelophilus]